MTPTPENPTQAMSPEWQKFMMQFVTETASGGSPSPDLVSTLNSKGFIVGQEKFRYGLIVARHNHEAISKVAQVRADLKRWGSPDSILPDNAFHPQLWALVEEPDGFGGTEFTWGFGPLYDDGIVNGVKKTESNFNQQKQQNQQLDPNHTPQ